MSINKTLHNASDLAAEFKAYGRGDQYSPEAFNALFNYLSDFSDDMGEPITIDVIELCCEWCEYEDLADLCEAYARPDSIPARSHPFNVRQQFKAHSDLKAVRDYVNNYTECWNNELISKSEELIAFLPDRCTVLKTSSGSFLVSN